MIAQLRKLVLGETWTVPLGIAATLLLGLGLDAAGPAWWRHAGGFVLLACALATLAASLPRRRPRVTPRRGSEASSGASRGPSSTRRRTT